MRSLTRRWNLRAPKKSFMLAPRRTANSGVRLVSSRRRTRRTPARESASTAGCATWPSSLSTAGRAGLPKTSSSVRPMAARLAAPDNRCTSRAANAYFASEGSANNQMRTSSL
eukprot:494504-Lingulodinium_polyedra.AAC.1